MIRPATTDDAAAIARIYNHYVLDTVVTFEEQAVEPEDIATRMRSIAAAQMPWLVAEQDGQVLGYAYGGAWHGRCAYRFSVETTVYLDPAARGRGLGSALCAALFEQLRWHGAHTLIACIALPNAASIALHEKFGMRQVGSFREVGYKFGRWIDVGYWQRVFDEKADARSRG